MTCGEGGGVFVDIAESTCGGYAAGMARRFRFSLRTLLGLLTGVALCLGFVARMIESAREQRDAVEAIEGAGGVVQYDWQPKLVPQRPGTWKVVYEASHWSNLLSRDKGQPGGPKWLRELVGDDCFQEVESVSFVVDVGAGHRVAEARARRAIPELQRLSPLRTLTIDGQVSDELVAELKAALPGCDVRRVACE